MNGLWRDLDTDEEAEFRLWARENYAPGDERNSLWHPVVLDECDKMDRGE